MDKASGLPARRAALAILSDVLRKRRALDVVTADVLSRTKLDERDAAFARAIANETLRRFGLLDALIRKYVPKAPQPHKAGATLEILMAGACELLCPTSHHLDQIRRRRPRNADVEMSQHHVWRFRF